IEKLTSLDRVDAAFKGDPAPDSLVDTKTGDDLGRRDLRTVVTDGKAKGTPTPIIQEQLLPNQNDPRVIAEARRQLEQLVTDAEWQAKISRGDKATVEHWLNLSNSARASENEAPWSVPFYGAPTA